MGRSPTLVALALVEAGLAREDAVLLLRKHQPYALNTKQAEFILRYHGRPAARSFCSIC
eukprot:m.100579 g.100579  ORF g.100579 m.100579 type:complete len:59 (+) comp14061_c4_seq3:600-776(+)